MSDEQSSGTTGIVERLRLGTGFTESDREGILGWLAPLETRLRAFGHQAVELELRVKDRSSVDPCVTLECSIAGQTRLVSTSKARELPAALIEVRDELVHQLGHAKSRHERRSRHRVQPVGEAHRN